MKKLWTRDFNLAIAGMVISAMGGIGLNVALSVVVFKETQSTMLSALFMVFSMIPQFVLPLVMGSMIDRRNPLKVLVANEIVLAALFFCVAAVSWYIGFNYIMYLAFSVLISGFGVVSQLASESVMPQVMDKENYMRGNAVINLIYPVSAIIVTPIAMKLFDMYGMPLILTIYGVTSLLDALLESRIKTPFEFIKAEVTHIKEYAGDIKEGVQYFLNDSAIRNVFIFVALMNFAYSSTVLHYPFFNRSNLLTNDHYALMNVVASAGYMAGGFLHYAIKIPDKRRFQIAVSVYCVFAVLDGAFLLMPFPVMCAVRFILGVAGMNSANIRVSAVQNHVPNTYRAKVNALLAVMCSAMGMLGQLAAGALGEIVPYWTVQFGFNVVYLLAMVVFILPKRNNVKALYNYDTQTV